MDPAPSSQFSILQTLQQFVGSFIQTTFSVGVAVLTWLVLQGRKGGAASMMEAMKREMDLRYPSLPAFNTANDEQRRRFTDIDLRIAEHQRDIRIVGDKMNQIEVSMARMEAQIGMLPLKVGSQVAELLGAQMAEVISKSFEDGKRSVGRRGNNGGD